MMVINEVICVSVSTVCIAHILGRSSPGCEFNPRHDVNNTDMFIHGQNSLPFTLADAFNFLGFFALHPSLFWTHPSLASLRLIPELVCTRSTPHPYACHCSPSVSIQTDGIAISVGCSPRLSLCLPHSTLSIPPSSFLSLTK